MPKYTYRFCDGTTSEVEVSDKQYALLKEMDAEERKSNSRYVQHNVPLTSDLSYVQQFDVECGEAFAEDAE